MKVSKVTGYLLCGMILAVGILFFVGNNALAEDVTITTYYPAPYGVYQELRTTDNTYLATDGGNVGIGTTAPVGKLNIVELDAGPNSAGDGASLVLGNPTGQHLELDSNEIHSMSGDSAALLYLNVEGGNITMGGNVGIEDTSPAYRLEIGGGDVNTTGGGYRDAGSCVAGTCASDIRLKRNIKGLSSALERIAQLEPISFEFIDPKFGPGTQYGLNAQDVEKVFPDIVRTGEDGIKKVQYGLKLHMYVIEAIKELKAENEILKQRITILEETRKL